MTKPQGAMSGHPLPLKLTAAEQRMRAAEYRQRAATASTRDIQAALLELARRYEEMADEKTLSLSPA